MRPRRALLYTPGDDMHKIRKASSFGADCVCLDMEDGVALSRKEIARQNILEALNTLDFGSSEKLARVNPVGSRFIEDDLAVVLHCHPDGIVIPKVEDRSQIAFVSSIIDEFEADHHLDQGMRILAIVETPRGIINLDEIARASPRLEALIFGAEDLAGELGAQRTAEGWEIFYARSAVLTYAAAYGLQAIDMVHIDFKDIEGLRKEAVQGARLGFSGKQVIHPSQILPVQEAFTPDKEAIDRAIEIIRLFDQHQASGVGAFAIDGKMIDAPAVKAARRVLERARAAGQIEDSILKE
jgi:citrate lyase beta subunit